MQKDIRETTLYRECEALYKAVRQPGTGQISDAAEMHASPDGKSAVFAGTLMEKLDGAPQTRICRVDLASGDTRLLTFGSNIDRCPRYSPDGRQIAFLSDRHREGDFQLYLLDAVSGAARAIPRVEGWVEYLHWSPDGKRILLGVAGHGADVAGGQGAVTSKRIAEQLPSWMPAIETRDGSHRWRRVWVHELATDRVYQVSDVGINVWEAAWCGNDGVAAVISHGPEEGLWYSAHVALIDLETGKRRELYTPRDQVGCPAASPSGKQLAIVEAVCSDRWIVAGQLLVLETTSGRTHSVDTQGVDITYTEWRSDRTLLVAGHRGFQTVVGACDLTHGTFRETWASQDITTGGRYASVSGLSEQGDCVLVGESFTKAPELAIIRHGEYQTVRSLDLGYAEHAQAIERVDSVTWQAPDGLEIQGWLLKPRGTGPYPLILNAHGGPIWQWRPVWLGRSGAAILMLLKRGYAMLLPNPRGSTGRGRDFARRILGDPGGAETSDHLSGIDYLVRLGIADPNRLGITGGSHGGFITSWLIGQDSRFAAAIPVVPVTNWVSEHLTSNLPHFCAISLADRYTNDGGRYFSRSPVMHAHKVKTPTLNICGRLDRCTPPEEAVQFHNALLENGVKSVLVTYPEEGHGIRKFPAAIDYAARIVFWFLEHLPATPAE